MSSRTDINRVRRDEHLARLNAFELKALEPMCIRTGKDLGDLTFDQVDDFLRICYNLEGPFRHDDARVLAAADIAAQSLTTIPRAETERHFHDPAFRDALDERIENLERKLHDLKLWATKGTSLAQRTGGRAH